MGRVTLAARVFAASHLTGTFVLRSGRKADHYFDKYRFESDPALLADIIAWQGKAGHVLDQEPPHAAASRDHDREPRSQRGRHLHRLSGTDREPP